MAWINGHPDFTDLPVDLGHERVIVVGNGNVALDVARVLTADPDELARTDIADHALTALRRSRVREVVIAARRGPAHSAFTLPELIGLTTTAEVVLASADREAVVRDLATVSDTLTRQKLEILCKLGDATAPTGPRIRLAYNLTPQRISGQPRATGMEFVVTGSEEVQTIEAGLVLSSIGYHGKAIKDLPFDDSAGVVPNSGGRVVDPDSGQAVHGAYVAGWIKRGPTGFIGTNKSCAGQTVQRLVDDFNSGLLRDPIAKPSALDKLVRERQPDIVDAAGWRAIDAAEVARGELSDRPRNKFTSIADMLDAASPPLPTRLVAAPQAGRSAARTGRPLDLTVHRGGEVLVADLFDRLAERPVMTERVRDNAVAVTPELVVERHDHAGAGFERTGELLVDVGHREMNGDRGSTQGHRGSRLPAGHLREVIGEHHREAVDAYSGVHQLAVGAGYSADLDRAKSLDVEVDRRRGVVDDEMRGQCGFDGDCHQGLLGVGVWPGVGLWV